MSSISDLPGGFTYIDDVIIVVSTFDEFLDKIRAVLSNARSRRVNNRLQKCTLTTCNHPIKVLGHVFFKKTRSIDSSRISALVELPHPKNVKEVRSCVGSVNYLRDWLPQISQELAPIIELTRGSESGNRVPSSDQMDPRSSTSIRKNQKNDHRPRSSIPSRQGLQDPHQHRRFQLGRRRSDMARNGSPCPAGTP
ncbi:hypothetical protein RCL1_005199 [Eukaryota sp. TZLM3-RCL]